MYFVLLNISDIESKKQGSRHEKDLWANNKKQSLQK